MLFFLFLLMVADWLVLLDRMVNAFPALPAFVPLLAALVGTKTSPLTLGQDQATPGGECKGGTAPTADLGQQPATRTGRQHGLKKGSWLMPVVSWWQWAKQTKLHHHCPPDHLHGVVPFRHTEHERNEVVGVQWSSS